MKSHFKSFLQNKGKQLVSCLEKENHNFKSNAEALRIKKPKLENKLNLKPNSENIKRKKTKLKTSICPSLLSLGTQM
jgi:hypothetical protein